MLKEQVIIISPGIKTTEGDSLNVDLKSETVNGAKILKA